MKKEGRGGEVERKEAFVCLFVVLFCGRKLFGGDLICFTMFFFEGELLS